MTQRRKRSLAIIVGALMMLIIGVGWRCYRQPIGYFDSTSIIGYHDGRDVLSFKKGVVWYTTSHGEFRMGTYSRSNGMWVWNINGRNWRIQPGVFSISFRDLANPTNVFYGRRKFSKPPLDEHGLAD